MTDNVPLLRPLPQRAFQITPTSTEPSTPPTPSNEASLPASLDFKFKGGSIPPSRTRSILNLTSSTLFGIYAPGEHEGSRDELNTPWGTGAMTPASPQPPGLLGYDANDSPVIGAFNKHTQIQHHVNAGDLVLPIMLRTLLLFVLGMAYGIIITHLHDNPNLVPVKVGGIDSHSWRYLIFWGVAAVVFGSLLPWFDIVWEDMSGSSDIAREDRRGTRKSQKTKDRSDEELEGTTSRPSSDLGAHWNPIVRSVGVFIGITFAIRKLPWESTLQVSLTLALVNPVLWYLIDRSKIGFLISAVVGIMGTSVLVSINPEMVPSPAIASNDYIESKGVITHQSIEVWTWMASVLFCSCVCFGNIGRRLAVSWPGRIKVHYNKGV